MDGKTRPSWPEVIGTAVIAAAAMWVLMVVAHRYLFGDSFEWSRWAGGSLGVFFCWFGLGVAERRGRARSPWRRQRDGE